MQPPIPVDDLPASISALSAQDQATFRGYRADLQHQGVWDDVISPLAFLDMLHATTPQEPPQEP